MSIAKIIGVINGRRFWVDLPEQVELTPAQMSAIVEQIPLVDISGKVDKETGKALLAITEAAKIHSNSLDHSHNNKSVLDTYDQTNVNLTDAISKKHVAGTDQGLDTDGANAVTAAQAKTAYTHSQAAHASVVNWQSVYRTILDSTGSHIAAKVAGTYGIPQGNPLAVSGTGTLYALNVIYIDSADYPTIDGKTAKLRVRCTIECNDVAPFTGTFKIGLHPVTRPATSGGAGVCIYTIGSPVTGSQVTGTNLAADSQNNLVGADFDLPANGFYVLAVITSATMATSSHVHISACLQIRNN